jgi:hypothetical protein
MDLLDNSKRKMLNSSSINDENKNNNNNKSKCCETKKEYNTIKKYIIKIPENINKQNLIDLKTFLSTQTP